MTVSQIQHSPANRSLLGNNAITLLFSYVEFGWKNFNLREYLRNKFHTMTSKITRYEKIRVNDLKYIPHPSIQTSSMNLFIMDLKYYSQILPSTCNLNDFEENDPHSFRRRVFFLSNVFLFLYDQYRGIQNKQ